MKRRAFLALTSLGAGYAAYRLYKKRKDVSASADFQKPHRADWKPAPRHSTISDLQKGVFDVLVVGGGASGAGCALDAATRGLRVALVDCGDFSSETSSKSTKLLHGGVRYLEKALKRLSWEYFKLVAEALYERTYVMRISSHLSRRLPIMLPVYDYYSMPYFFAGLVVYDWISGGHSLGRSYLMGADATHKMFPCLKKDGLKGSVVYYDAQHNDARNNLMVALTAAYYGATVSNYVEVIRLIKKKGRVLGARCRDLIGGKVFDISAKGVINTTGPFTDGVRALDGEKSSMIVPSSGTHIVLPREYAPEGSGLVCREDIRGSVLFFVPWMDKAVVGCTDTPCRAERGLVPKEEDVDFIVESANKYLAESCKLTRDKVLSVWSGIRPLARDSAAGSTQEISRNHVVSVSQGNLLTLAGGKWTTYRKMAEDAVDRAVEVFQLSPQRACVTRHVKTLGSNGYGAHTLGEIVRKLNVSRDTAVHLDRTYGARAQGLKAYIGNGGPSRLVEGYPFLVEEVRYAIENEMAVKAQDILARRMRLGFIDVMAAAESVRAVCRVFRERCGWSVQRMRKEERDTHAFLQTLGLGMLRKWRRS